LLCVGQATRIAEYLSPLPKRYVAVAVLGVETDTDDRTGEPVMESEGWRTLRVAEVVAAFTEQVGERLQLPPTYSAKKVGGERAYRRARRGERVEGVPVPVTIYSLSVQRCELPEVHFEVTCSSGTYVRAIARDAGRSLGCGAHLSVLRRTGIGTLDVAAALPLERLGDAEAVAAHWLTPLEAVSHLKAVELGPEAVRRVVQGKAVDAPPGVSPDGPLALVHGGELIGIGESDDGRIRPRKVFGAAE
ncbi:MAG TPA: tRNA pseudouridine(55) synthase TruB, partial [Longimicrobiales bacterium]|nr:tRNA pseudouridine(55) synthase TruB [Longimicrobiales bacterium]